MSEITLRRYAEPLKGALENLLNNGPEYCRVGICGNLPLTLGIRYPDLEILFMGWPEHSGDDAFPVEGAEAYSEGRDFLWEGENLRKRQSLIRHMLVRLEEL